MNGTRLPALLCCLYLLALGGCRAREPAAGTLATDPVLGNVPDDLILDVTILPGRNLGRYSEAHLERSRYILFCDGSLHGDVGPSVAVLMRPGRIRTLTREEMADLWLVARRTGFAEIADADFEGNPALLAPGPNEILVVIGVLADSRSGTFIRRTAPGAVDPALRGFLRAIADLAWASDAPPFERVVMPLRYDLGPNPFAPFLPPAPIRLPGREGEG